MKTRKKKNKIISSVITICPVCGKKTFKVVQRIENIPYFGEVLETFASCSNCKYKTSDILALEKHDSTNQKIKVKSLDDFKLRFIKSKFAKIEIPELGIHISPGPNSEAYITNIEGFLLRVKEVLKKTKLILPDKMKEAEKKIEEIDKVIECKKPITIILEDVTGQSRIIKEKGGIGKY